MIVLGVDPGFDRLGIGIVSVAHGSPTHIHHECVQTSRDDDIAERLVVIRNALHQAIITHHPTMCATEKLFFQTNVKTALAVGMARGVILLAAADAGLPMVELTPNQVKQGITGSGNADKQQVQMMVKRLLRLSSLPQPDDAADALAIAIIGGLFYRTRA